MHVRSEITSLPQKAWVVSSSPCAEALFALLHTACRPITQCCASAAGPPGQKGSQLPITLQLIFSCHPVLIFSPCRLFAMIPSFFPCLVHVFQGKGGCMVQWFVCVYESSHVLGWSVKAVDCCCHAAWFSLGVLECEGRSGEASRRREDDLSFVVSEILYVLPQL